MEYSDGERVVGSNQIDRAVALANQRSSSQSWTETRDAWENATSSSEDQRVQSLASGLRASYDEARQISRDATDSYSEGERYQEAARRLEQSGYTVDGQLTQQFVDFVGEQQRTHGSLVPHGWNPTQGRAQTDAERRDEAFWMEKFEGRRLASVVDTLVGPLDRPSAAGLMGPSVTKQGALIIESRSVLDEVAGAGPAVDVSGRGDDVEARRTYVRGGQDHVEGRIAQADAKREKVEEKVKGGAEKILERSVPDPSLRNIAEAADLVDRE